MLRNFIFMMMTTAVVITTNRPSSAVEPSSRDTLSPQSRRTEMAAFPMPTDTSTPVVTMSFTDPRFAQPLVDELAIYADGRVTVTAEASSRRKITAQLPREEWVKIQKVLFEENDLLGCCSDELSDAICSLRRQRRRPTPGPEAAATIITIHGEDLAHEVCCHAVGLTATQLPDLPEVQRLFACQQCLQNVIHVVRAGGYEEVHRTLETVNNRLERQIPGCGPLSLYDLSLVDSQPDGTRYLQFSRTPCTTNQPPNRVDGLRTDERFLMVSVYERPGQPLEISIIGDSPAQ